MYQAPVPVPGVVGRLTAISAVVALAVGCAIAGQTPAPGTPDRPAASATAAASVAPTVATATGTPAAASPAATPGGTAQATAGATGSPSAGPTEAPTPTAEPTPAATPAGEVNFGNWPLYIDKARGRYPTLEQFQEQTGITVNYLEDINDNEEFFGRLQPDLAAGNPTGYDIIVVTDWMIERMARLGYLEPLDHSQLPNFEANAQDLYRDPWYDPGNTYSVPWQSGITGIAYNPTLTGREITTFDDLLDPEFAGRVGMFSEMRDTMSLTLLSMGVDLQQATIEDATAARDKLLEAADRGQFRAFYGNDYYDALAAGDLAISIAWSGDISQMKLFDNPDIEFIVPDTGGLLWTDNMAIPLNAEHPVDAHALMNYYYDVANATAVTEWVGYFSPVAGVPEQVLLDAEAAREEGDEEWAAQLEVISQTAFPDDELLSNVFTYKALTEEEERVWNELFNEVVSG